MSEEGVNWFTRQYLRAKSEFRSWIFVLFWLCFKAVLYRRDASYPSRKSGCFVTGDDGLTDSELPPTSLDSWR